MATVIVKGYEVTQKGIQALDFDKLYAQYKNTLFKDAKNASEAGTKIWPEIKKKVLSDPNKKKVDEITYSVALNQGGKILLFAHGTGKKETLQKIFLAEKENLGKNEEAKAESTKPTSIDLGDTKIPFEERFEAVKSKDKNIKITGKFNEEDSYSFYRGLIGQDKINLYLKSKDYQNEFFTGFAGMVKENKEIIDKYSFYSSTEMATMLKELMKDANSDPDFYKEIVG